MSQLVYVLPVHNEEGLLTANVARLTARLGRFPGSEVFLVENGSRDGSWALGTRLARGWSAERGKPLPRAEGLNVPVRAFREVRAGIGYAYHRGLSEALDRFGPSSEHWAVLTGADLPFGSSDLDAALALLDDPRSRILMGSKAHPHSRAQTGIKRRLMSAGYRVARRVVVGMKVGDSQGSVFVRLDFAAALVPQIKARGFFYSTELCHFAERAGETIIELPVVLESSQRASTVRPGVDGLTMARELWNLRHRA